MNEFSDEKFLALVAEILSCALEHGEAIELTAEIGRRLSLASAAVHSAAVAVAAAQQAEAAAVSALTSSFCPPQPETLGKRLERMRATPQRFPLIQPQPQPQP